MQLCLHAIGKKMPTWVTQASDEYVKRFPAHWQFAVKEFAQAQGSTPNVTMAKEADLLLSTIPSKAHVVTLDNRGKQWATDQLAKKLEYWQETGKPIFFLIGGADGLHSQCRERADDIWSLSNLTFPHPMVRVIVLEQLYRAHSLIVGHPYHRA